MKKLIVKLLGNILKKNLKKEEIEKLIEIPPSLEMGDYSFPCFILAKKLKKNPNQIAEELKEKIKSKDFEKIESSGPYINFFVKKLKLAENTIKEILTKKENFGKTNIGKGKKIMLEFSQPNTHKAFHVGHIRGTSLGESLSRIFEFCNNKVIRANYSGDTGMHIAKWIWCYKKYHSKEKLKNDESWIASIYVDAVKKLGTNEEFQEEVNIINQKIESKEDKEINQLWEKTRKLSVESWKNIYKELNTKFDVHYFESEVKKRGREISNELVKKGIAKKSQGAVIMDLEKYNLGIWVLLRKDGTVLYSGKDLALLEKKSKKFKNIERNIYVIANEQDLHMKQFFKTIELMKSKSVSKSKHINYGMVRLPTGKMSSRTGENILYSDFMKEMIEYTRKQIKKKDDKISKHELEKRALIISIAAVKYSMLKQSSGKNIIFQKEDVLNFEGNTGAYLLYSYARASSILRKVKNKKDKSKTLKLELKEIELIKKLSEFQDVVLNSYKNLNPSLIANYSYQLAQIFNEFYHSCQVIGSSQKTFRIKLVRSFKQVLKNSLYLLGIEIIEEM
ncbi:arginine--tRNA ligase [Candidatus Pacearchaeota archaeon]|nr:arginine--tRNA ligase [Candidatus Pacearchaeota archaeon]|tara:strand:- start:2048 stop:3736 length:1689 start_codon:yes stop_codon:yes gene_type:complete